MEYTVTRFTRLEGGQTEDYKSERRETLAYLDHYAGEVAGVVVFDPYKGSRKVYSPRAADKAAAILAKHLSKLGYTEKVEG